MVKIEHGKAETPEGETMTDTAKLVYEVDEAMMGSEWDGDLAEFCAALQAVLDADGERVQVVAVTDAWNGAADEEEGLVTPAHWLRAMETIETELART